MVWLFRFLRHALRLRSFELARWVMDYEETERSFHRKAREAPPFRAGRMSMTHQTTAQATP